MPIPDFIRDINPRHWLTRYRNTAVPYMIAMGVFYLAIGIAMQQITNILAAQIIANYHITSVPISVIMGLSSGPLEEVTFFGIPYYLSGNYLVILACGILWSVLHIFNTQNLVLSNLAIGSVFFTIPHIFFSLRTWISGKGWFAVAFHTSWNAIVLGLQCMTGTICIAMGTGIYFYLDLLSLFAVVILTAGLYRTRRCNETRKTRDTI
jgi:hypothetical protein